MNRLHTTASTLVLVCLLLAGSAPVSAPEEARAPAPQAIAPAPANAWLRGASLPGPFPAEVTEVVDGDTIEARVTIWLGQEVTTRIRLRGVDAAETQGLCAEETRQAREATGALRRMLARGPVMIRDVGKDKYGGRVLAEVLLPDGRSVNAEMLRTGHARPYAGGRRQSWCGVDLTARR